MKDNKRSLKSFKKLWIQFDGDNVDKHQLFFKEHSIRNQDLEHPRGKTLFIINIPPYVTSIVLKKVFGKLCGVVSNVFFPTSKGFKTAYVVFERESALETALELPENSTVIINDEQFVYRTGLAKWCKEYNNSICDEKKMKMKIEDYMKNYDQRIINKVANEKARAEKEEDNDGWVTVTGQKKRGQFALARKESVIHKVQEKEEQKNKKKQLLNFYTFQIRESKKQNLAELRKKFELDKKRLQDLKSKRTFKPF